MWQEMPAMLEGVALCHRMRAGDVPLLMVHGIGPGTDAQANFGPLLNRLGPRWAPHVIDLAGFGASGRTPSPNFFDVPFWLRQICQAIGRVMDMHGRPPLLIGNSVGGALVLKAAAAMPVVRRVMAIGAPAGPPAPPALRAFWTAPRDAADLAQAMRPMSHAQAAPDPAVLRARLLPFLQGDYSDYFNTMLAEPDQCLRDVALRPAEAARIAARVIFIHGRQDRACPPCATQAALLPEADTMLLGGCGHQVIAERTDTVLAAIEQFAERVDPL